MPKAEATFKAARTANDQDVHRALTIGAVSSDLSVRPIEPASALTTDHLRASFRRPAPGQQRSQWFHFRGDQCARVDAPRLIPAHAMVVVDVAIRTIRRSSSAAKQATRRRSLPRQFLQILSGQRPQAVQDRQRPAGTGAGHRQQEQPDDRPRDGQPHLDAPFRRRLRPHAR